MTTPRYTESPFTPGVHNQQRASSSAGLPQDTQRGLRGKLIESIMQIVAQAITGVFLPGPLGAAFEQLHNFFQNILPDQIKGPLGQLVGILTGIFDFIPIVGPGLSFAVEGLAEFFGILKDKDDVVQGAADTANAGVSILAARVDGLTGGAYLYDTFDREESDLGVNYDVSYSGGSGSIGTRLENSGVARWSPSGFSDTRFVARETSTPMTTNAVRVSTLINKFRVGTAGNQANIRLIARCDATKSNYVVATIGSSGAEIGCVVSGVYTRFGSSEILLKVAAGDLWDFEVGSLGDEWRFRILQNNAVRVDRTDLGHVSMKDTTPGTEFMWTGFGGDTAIIWGVFPGTTVQVGMPDYQVFVAADF